MRLVGRVRKRQRRRLWRKRCLGSHNPSDRDSIHYISPIDTELPSCTTLLGSNTNFQYKNGKDADELIATANLSLTCLQILYVLSFHLYIILNVRQCHFPPQLMYWQVEAAIKVSLKDMLLLADIVKCSLHLLTIRNQTAKNPCIKLEQLTEPSQFQCFCQIK